MVRIPVVGEPGVEVGSVDNVGVGQQSYIRASAPDTTAQGRQLTEFGQQMAGLGRDVVEARRDQALHDAEMAYLEFERGLYDPQNGIMNAQGADAMNLTNTVQEQFAALRDGIMGRYGSTIIGNSGRRALESYFAGHEHRLWRQAAVRETNALRRAQTGGGGGGGGRRGGGSASSFGGSGSVGTTGFPNMNLQQEMVADLMAVAAENGDTENLERYLALGVSTVDSEWEARNGPLEEGDTDGAFIRDQFTEYRVTGMLEPALDVLRERDPEAAVELVTNLEDQGLFDPSSAVELRRDLHGPVLEQRGNRYVDAALSAVAAEGNVSGTVDPINMPPPATRVGPTVAAAAVANAGAPQDMAMTGPFAVPFDNNSAVGPTVEAADAVARGVPQQTALATRVPIQERNIRHAEPPPPGLPPNATPDMVAFAQGRYAEETWRTATRRYGNPILAAVAMEADYDVADAYAEMSVAVDQEILTRAAERLRSGGLSGISLSADPANAALILADMGDVEAHISSIADPEQRAVAMELLNARLGEREAAVEGARAEMLAEIYQRIDAGFEGSGAGVTRTQLNAFLSGSDVSRVLGTSAEDVRQYFGARSVGITPGNEASVVGWLQALSEGNPQGFADVSLVDYRGSMERSTFERLTALQAEIRGGGSAGVAVTTSELRANIQTELGGLEDAADRNALETAMHSWINGYMINSPGGMAPNALQQRQAAQAFMAQEIVADFDPVGARNRQQGRTLVEFIADANQQGLDAVLEGNVTLNVPMADGSSVERRFTEGEMQGVVAMFVQETGAPPTPGELVAYLGVSASDRMVNPNIQPDPTGYGSLFTSFERNRLAGRVRVGSPISIGRGAVDPAVADQGDRAARIEAVTEVPAQAAAELEPMERNALSPWNLMRNLAASTRITGAVGDAGTGGRNDTDRRPRRAPPLVLPNPRDDLFIVQGAGYPR